jgi:hypothetical protein
MKKMAQSLPDFKEFFCSCSEIFMISSRVGTQEYRKSLFFSFFFLFSYLVCNQI